MELFQITKLVGFATILISNYYIYDFTKRIKKNKKKIKNKCGIDNNSRRVYILKNLSFFMGIYIIINFALPINKYLLKIPLISGLYSIILFIILVTQYYIFFNLISLIKKNNCYNDLKMVNFEKTIVNRAIQSKSKYTFIMTLTSYIIFVYI